MNAKRNYTMIGAEPDNRSLKQRLADCEAYLAEEKAQPNPSAVYIEDLELSIKQLKRNLGV